VELFEEPACTKLRTYGPIQSRPAGVHNLRRHALELHVLENTLYVRPSASGGSDLYSRTDARLRVHPIANELHYRPIRCTSLLMMIECREAASD
jgi:hypothetical protein